MLIDSHHHLWNYSQAEYGWISEEMSVLRRNFGPTELRQIAEASKVDGFISVQARQTIEETNDLLNFGRHEPLIQGVVGWLPLMADDLDSILDQFNDQTLLKGVRHVVQDEPDDRFLLRDDFNLGVSKLAGRGLVYDILIFGRQLPAAIEFIDRHPTQEMVLDHIAKPTVRRNSLDVEWRKNFKELAKRATLTCKFSGVLTEIRDQDWDIETIRPYWETALEAFTPKRLMFGSDWPVCLLKAEHTRWLQIVNELASELSTAEQAEFYANTAIRAYHLDA